ncbi:predicted protein [Uncinocarpus reesii 1704]|uniref:F-box domain-containing protein n=1 Tax=Uncinocarpus reesii (strain UAMH 1704) TaxID=336963 RepID=C4JXZ3_UNCRE|nr:uncharacterized protein UREG_07044 [Uncinocarpus reesii 1704]EEP82179.1 predicted protein [Uncinocarpus reesii 1704]
MDENHRSAISMLPLRFHASHAIVNFTPHKSWPPNRVSTDIFFLISEYLTRSDLARLRLVNREFAHKLEYLFFYQVSVPFSPDFYVAKTTKEDDVGIFERVGSNISRFAITVDIDQGKGVLVLLTLNPFPLIDLRRLPAALFLPPLPANPICPNLVGWAAHGRLDRDRVLYQRLRDMELLAFRQRRMAKAFSHLNGVKEIALSLNTGLGWLPPPVVYRFQPVFQQPSIVFRDKHPHLSSSQYIMPDSGARSGTRIAPAPYVFAPAGEKEVTTWYGTDGSQFCDACRDQAQLELLSETSHMIKQFLDSFFPAAITNTHVFQNLHTLTFAGISSKLLEEFGHHDKFFTSFSTVKTLTILVYPDWREFDGTNLRSILPSGACIKFFKLLKDQVVSLPNIESLTLGYIGGGEYANGLLARNRYILPAPIMGAPMQAATGNVKEGVLAFNHVKSLTFENCWFSPTALKRFLQMSQKSALERLTFDSCSLVSTPGRRHWAPTRSGCSTVGPPQGYNRRLPSGSWSSILAQFGPHLPITDMRRLPLPSQVDFSNLKLRQHSPPVNLQRMQFISCGYALLGDFYHQTNLVLDDYSNHRRQADAEARLRNTVQDVDVSQVPVYAPFTRRVYTEDPLLGSIIQSIDAREEFMLKWGFGFRLGWPEGDGLCESVEADGWRRGGTARFSGALFYPRKEDIEKSTMCSWDPEIYHVQT